MNKNNNTETDKNIVTLKLMHKGKKEWNVLFNDTLNTFYYRFYGVR